MRAVLGWVLSCWSVVASAAVPASVSSGLSDVPAERWKPCPQCGEDFDRECPICDGLGRVLAIMAFRYMRRALGDSGSARMSWAEKGEVYSSLRADGWTHQEIERGWKGLAP